MDTYMVIARFRPDTDMDEVFAVVADELAQVEVLRTEGLLGSVHISPERGAAFLETFAADADGAASTVMTLPMSRWWDLDIYPTATPTQAADQARSATS